MWVINSWNQGPKGFAASNSVMILCFFYFIFFPCYLWLLICWYCPTMVKTVFFHTPSWGPRQKPGCRLPQPLHTGWWHFIWAMLDLDNWWFNLRILWPCQALKMGRKMHVNTKRAVVEYRIRTEVVEVHCRKKARKLVIKFIACDSLCKNIHWRRWIVSSFKRFEPTVSSAELWEGRCVWDGCELLSIPFLFLR